MNVIRRWWQRGSRWTKLHKRWVGYGVIGLVGLIIVVQLFYPAGRLLPFVSIDDISVSGWQKKDAAWQLDRAYEKQPIQLYFGSNTNTNYTLKPADMGLTTRNTKRIESMNYPWYMRLLPTSLFWYGRVQNGGEPAYDRNETTFDAYMKQTLGESCDVKPVNASLKAKGAKLEIVPGSNGGTCKLSDVSATLKKLSPHLTVKTQVRVPMKEIPPVISDDDARKLVTAINKKLAGTITVQAGTQTVAVEGKMVASWLDSKEVDGKLTVEVNSTRAADVMNKEIAPKVAVAAGVTKVTTLDFQEVSRQDGPGGQALNIPATGAAIVEFLLGKSQAITAATQPVAPRVEYTRSYSPTDVGLSALLANYAKDHPGTYGMQLIELSSKRRRAAYNESHQFITASTYKLFVAYGTLKKIEAGEWQWSNASAGGRDTAACFDDMIVKSDNACAEALLERYGYNNLTRDIRALGLSSASGFIGDTPKSTAADLGLFMAMLESGQMPIQPANRDRFIGALKRNIYRQGIPAGASGTVADKVGFLNGLFHDAAIVYSPSGTYVLVIMTDGSSWANIAELTKQIEALRAQ